VQEIVVKLWRNEPQKNWTVEINGERHEAVTIEWVHERVYCALLDAEDRLIEFKRKMPLQ
jgi:hypothetical protein